MAAASAALPVPGARSLLRFLRLVGQLKRVPRTGWVYRNVEKPESVSDHMYRMAVMALVIRDDHLNKDRCVRLALVHDMAECIVGDIAPADNIPKEEKHRREEKAMKQLTQLLPEDLKKELYELWEDGIVDPVVPGPDSSLGVISHAARETFTPGCHVPVGEKAMTSLAELGLERVRPHLSNKRGPPEITLRHTYR